MNLKVKLSKKKEERLFIDEPTMPLKLSTSISSLLPNEYSQIVVLCIGTDRSTGDSLGPLTGTLLKEKNTKNLVVYGTLDDPIHALNLNEKLEQIYTTYSKPFIIAIDACLGKVKSVGAIITGAGSIQPGRALKKELPSVGDIHVSGVVNVSGYMEFFVLQNTRLHIVMQMARNISNGLYLLDREITYFNSVQQSDSLYRSKT